MKFKSICLESLAYVIPPIRWTTAEIEKRLSPIYERLKLPYGRLELMTGIRERRFWDHPVRPSQASAEAGEKALGNSTFDRTEIDLLIHSAVSRDQLEPATASNVHHLLHLNGNTQIFDLSNACLGFINALVMAGGMVQSGHVRKALVTAGENGLPLVEKTIKLLLNPALDRKTIKPYIASLTIGAGAVAATLCHADNAPAGSPLLLAGIVETDTTHNHLCQGDVSECGEGLNMQTDSEELLNAGIDVAKRAWSKFKIETEWDENTPDRIICHQVGTMHRKRLYEALNLDQNKDFSTFEILGNMGSASLPVTLAMAREQGAIKKGDKVACLGIGSGLSCMMLALQF